MGVLLHPHLGLMTWELEKGCHDDESPFFWPASYSLERLDDASLVRCVPGPMCPDPGPAVNNHNIYWQKLGLPQVSCGPPDVTQALLNWPDTWTCLWPVQCTLQFLPKNIVAPPPPTCYLKRANKDASKKTLHGLLQYTVFSLRRNEYLYYMIRNPLIRLSEDDYNLSLQAMQ